MRTYHHSSPSAALGSVALACLAAALLILALAPAAPALAGEGCPNEQARAESNINPTTGQPYDIGLPECRAYEMVTPLEKQAHDTAVGVSVAPEGNRVEVEGKGTFGEPGFDVGAGNDFVAQRGGAGWETWSLAFPASIFTSGNAEELSLNLASVVDCGKPASAGTTEQPSPLVACILREEDGSNLVSPTWSTLAGQPYAPAVVGASESLSTALFQGVDSGEGLLPADPDGLGIYEVSGLGTASPTLSLVNVENDGTLLTDPSSPRSQLFYPAAEVGVATAEAATFSRQGAVSANGRTVYFTATPTGGVRTLYARTGEFAGGMPGAPVTVPISNPTPAECSTCSSTASAGIFQGASTNGAKAFFITSQQLVNADTDTTPDLYEYDFDKPAGEHIVQVSGGGLGDLSPGSGANVQGVTSISEDGSHVYFVATGVLTTVPNGLEQTATAGADNLYGYDTETGETKFVATLSPSDAETLWKEALEYNWAQTTPDGRYLIFASYQPLITSGPEAITTHDTQNVYRYDFQTGEILRISHSAGPGGTADFGNNNNTEGMDATFYGNRAISSDGSTVIFATRAQLQADDVDNPENLTGSCRTTKNSALAHEEEGCDVYEWHEGTVSMISDGQPGDSFANALAIYEAGMSANGQDIFFQTRIQLVGQDTDELVDVYDARVDGGFAAPTPEPSCSGEACQGAASSLPTFGAPGSSTFTGGQNLTTPPEKKLEEEAPKQTTGRVKITGHSFKNETITLTVKAPAKGKLTATGTGLKKTTKSVKGAAAYKLPLKLTPAEQKKLKAKKKLTLNVKVAFKPASGKSSTATVTVAAGK